MKPNLFKLATSELSQDGFYTWLLLWADDECNQYDPALCETGKDLIRLLIGRDSPDEIHQVKVERQWNHIDIKAVINDEYLLIIENKTDTLAHSQQLERYKAIAEAEANRRNLKPAFVYLKSGNESLTTLRKAEEIGYKVIDRKAVLNVLNQRLVQNEIFNDFKKYLTSIEALTNACDKWSLITSNRSVGEGFYMRLQELLEPPTGWKYVPNPQGGFLAFWYHFTEIGESKLYIQIENAFSRGIRVVVKIGNFQTNGTALPQMLNDLQTYAQRNGLSITKPGKYKTGKTVTLAVLQNPFPSDSENVDYDQFVSTLRSLGKALDEYSSATKQYRSPDLSAV
jgi:hypothetical protein